MHDYFEPPYDTPYQEAWQDEYDRLYRQDMYNRKDEELLDSIRDVVNELLSKEPDFDTVVARLIYLEDELNTDFQQQILKTMKVKERRDV